jgi:hypothetical protein
MKDTIKFPGPIHFTEDEIEQARAGNSGPLEKRLYKEKHLRARMYGAVRKPRKEAELKRLVK